MAKHENQDRLFETALRLKRARVAVFPTATGAAEAMGVNGVTYRAHENGQNGFRRDDAIRYAAAFGVSLEWLLTGEGGEEPVRPATVTPRGERFSLRMLSPERSVISINEAVVPTAVALQIAKLLAGGGDD